MWPLFFRDYKNSGRLFLWTQKSPEIRVPPLQRESAGEERLGHTHQRRLPGLEGVATVCQKLSQVPPQRDRFRGVMAVL